MKEKLKEIIIENQDFEVDNIIFRENIDIPIDSGLIVSLIGSRRSGKTYLLYDIIRRLKQNGISKTKIVFINFEDERLTFTQQNLDQILQSYQELYPDILLKQVYFFFDEIQNVVGWEKFVRRMFDSRSKNIFITGSNSKLLSSEIATELRGRTLSFTVYPFSFREFINAHGVSASLNTQSQKSKVINIAEKFIFEGGFPELVSFNKRLKIKMLQEYFNVMIYRDIIERYAVSNPDVLKFFLKKVFASVSVPLSINKVYNDLKSMGYKISNMYLYEYMNHCNAVFMTQAVSKFNFSEIKQAKSDKKVYVIDNGLLSAIDFKVTENRGILLENAVALEFLKQGKDIFYYKDTHECDFVVKDDLQYCAVQVSWSIAENETRNRELRGLVSACKQLGIKHGTIITFDEADLLEFDNIAVEVVPFYKYFIANSIEVSS
ncbi:MAG: ATP-binding protein [Bacteroidales bacterium]